MTTREFAVRYRRFRAPIPWFHDLWYAALDDPAIERLYIQGPREHAKTTVVLTWAQKRLAENHHLRVGIISGSDELAMKFLGQISHQFDTNDEMRRDFNGGRSWRGDKWTEHEIVLADARDGPDGIEGKDVTVFSVGQGAQISSRHCDILIVDDVESAKTVKSDLVRESTRQWWAREVAPVLSPGGKLVVVGTRKHFDDLYAHIIAGDVPVGDDVTDATPTWTVLDAAKSVYLPDGSPIWPEFWSAERLRRRKAELDKVDLLAWPQEYLNEPRAGSTQMFFPEKWPTYAGAPWGLTIYQFWDLAISEKTTADFTVGWTIGVDEANDVYLLERRRGHWDFNTTLREIGDMGEKWAAPSASGTLAGVGIEQVAYQAAAVQEALRRTMLPIIPVVPDKDKVTRARLLEARAAALKVLRPAECDWWSEFAVEAYYFPDGPHDDQIDALSGAVKMAGWTSDQVGYAYGVWTCENCSHKFVWAPARPCPECGRSAPDTFDNPETLRFGALGQETPARPGTAVAAAAAPTDGEQLAARIRDLVASGRPMPDAEALADWPRWRDTILIAAAFYAEHGQAPHVAIALEEVKRLDALARPTVPATTGFTVILNEPSGRNGNGSHQ